MKVGHTIAAFGIFAILVGLFLQGYDGITDSYNLTKTDLDEDGYNVMEELHNLNILGGIKKISDGLQSITGTTSSGFDIAGGLLALGLGFLQTFFGIITFPIEIIGVITGFYYIPPILSGGIVVIITTYILVIRYERQTGGS